MFSPYASVDYFARMLRSLHWTMAGGFVSCAGLIQYKNQLSKEDKKKYAGQIMFWHKR
jgi:hypothetical protein